MYFLKFYDDFNNEITARSKESSSVKDLEPEAIIQTKHNKRIYAIIEDENFDRFGWYENGHKTS